MKIYELEQDDNKTKYETTKMKKKRKEKIYPWHNDKCVA